MAYYHEDNMHRASSSAFAWGDMIFTDYSTGCLRKILIQSRGYESQIDPKYGIVGKLNEDRHEARLKGRTFTREPEFSHPLAQGVKIKGHADFLIFGDDACPDSVDELKSVQSTNSRLRYIRKGDYLPENLAQLVCYMWAFNVVDGRLIYTFWEQDDETGEWEANEERIFKVHIDVFGRISVDSKTTKYTVYDLLSHQAQAADVIATGKVAQRPLNHDAPFVSPCAYCVFKTVCDKYDSGEIESSEAFVTLAKECKK